MSHGADAAPRALPRGGSSLSRLVEVVFATAMPDDVGAIGVPAVASRKSSGAGPASAGRVELLRGLPEALGEQAGRARELLPGDVDSDWLARQGFTAKAGEALTLRSARGAPVVVLLGLGTRDEVDTERWRRAAGAFVEAAGESGATAAILLPEIAGGGLPGGDVSEICAAIAEGAVLAAYRFLVYNSVQETAALERVAVVGDATDERCTGGVRRGIATASAAAFARDLVNTAPSDLPPRRFAEMAVSRLDGRLGTTVEVWDEERITAERLGGVMAVARGSHEPPRLVRASYDPGDASTHVVLVGKGITFDSGGLSLKTRDGMIWMKADMTGAAVVIAVVSACAELSVPVKVTAIAPLAENMPGGRAQKPGDVLTARNGKTIEVLNTDAEGRLVLADGLSLAAELEPDAIVDIATLTGAQVAALGSGIGALLGTHEGLLDALREAGDRAGERLWPLPLPDDYETQIASGIADMKNVGRVGEAGAIVAALLLRRFTGDHPWAHIDISGPSVVEERSAYLVKGASGFGVRALLEWLSRLPARA